jgi:16S rRNA (guanine1516-N2)-methyltransferase
MSLMKIAVWAKDPLAQQKAIRLARELSIPLIQESSQDDDLLLVCTETHLELQETKEKTKPIYIDFLSAGIQYRLKTGGRGELIARAIGIKGKYLPSVIDATAGLGRDAMVLAHLGCHVTMVERSPIIAALLQDGLDRAREVFRAKGIDLRLVCADAKHYLQQLLDASIELPEVIYLDPMFPERTKSALVKKEMRILKKLLGAEENTKALFQLALRCARKRVVVKRPPLAPTLSEEKPTIVYRGKTCRFDVYVVTCH